MDLDKTVGFVAGCICWDKIGWEETAVVSTMAELNVSIPDIPHNWPLSPVASDE